MGQVLRMEQGVRSHLPDPHLRHNPRVDLSGERGSGAPGQAVDYLFGPADDPEPPGQSDQRGVPGLAGTYG